MSELAHGPECACPRCTGFQPGNLEALKHGAYVSPVRLSDNPEVTAFAESIRAAVPVAHAADGGAIQRLALIYWRLKRSAEALDAVDEAAAENAVSAYLGEGGVPLARLREDHARWHGLADRLEAQLGMNLASRAKMGLHLATAQRMLTVVDLHAAAAAEAALEVESGEAGS